MLKNILLYSYLFLSIFLIENVFAMEENDLSMRSPVQIKDWILATTEDLEKDYITYVDYLSDPSGKEMPEKLRVIKQKLPTDQQKIDELFKKIKTAQDSLHPVSYVANSINDWLNSLQEPQKANKSNIAQINVAPYLAQKEKSFDKGLGIIQLLSGNPEGHLTLLGSYKPESPEDLKNAPVYLKHLAKYYGSTFDFNTYKFWEFWKALSVNKGLEKDSQAVISSSLSKGKEIAENILFDFVNESKFNYFMAFSKGFNRICRADGGTFFVSKQELETIQKYLKQNTSPSLAYGHYILSKMEMYTNNLSFGYQHMDRKARTRSMKENDFNAAKEFKKSAIDKLTRFLNLSDSEKKVMEEKFDLKVVEEALKDKNHWAWGEF